MTVKLFSAMAKAFPEIENATKDKVNPAFRSKYADLGAVVEAVKPALVKNDLWFAQINHEQSGGVCIETIVCHSSGEQFSFGKLFLPAAKQDAQGYGSALTYARRYSLMSAFGIAAEDDDGNAATRSRPPANDELAKVERIKPIPLAGPITSATALKASYQALDREIRGCGDLDQFEALMATNDNVALMKQLERDAPKWLHGSDTLPAEFVPLFALIAETRTELTAAANEGWRNDSVRAG